MPIGEEMSESNDDIESIDVVETKRNPSIIRLQPSEAIFSGGHRSSPASVIQADYDAKWCISTLQIDMNSEGFCLFRAKMYLQFYINENGDKVYTTKKESPLGLATQSAHPARFSPDDKFSRQRVLLKKRFGLLPTQKPAKKY
ncbi:hypothetical protein L6452_43082 [Arctium lappa]|uniref:Uncharacterized protein n=1 Tax=Arctium lappa TaxID=4217 RepID=A0ACB8XP74_ARCLA|nr:hypothetical protein L6452_43082 [Arctium lappa]